MDSTLQLRRAVCADTACLLFKLGMSNVERVRCYQRACEHLCGRRERIPASLERTAVLGGRRRRKPTQGHHPDRCYGRRRIAWNVEDLPVPRDHSRSPVRSGRAR